MTTLTQESATDGQIKQLTRMASDAAEKAVKSYTDVNYLTKAQVEKVKGDADFAARIRAATRLALSELSVIVTDIHKSEEVESTYDYWSGYKVMSSLDQLRDRTNDVAKQVMRLTAVYPELVNPTVGKPDLMNLPAGAEKWCAVPNIWRPEPALPGSYNYNVVRGLNILEQERGGKFDNYCDGQLGPGRLRQSARTESAMQKQSKEQGHPDILVIAAQFGLQHRGRSVRRALEVMAGQGQYGLGAFVISTMLLTHPERLQHHDDLRIDCAGDEFDDPDADDRFDHATVFEFRLGRVLFCTCYIGHADALYGSASGVVPQ